MKKLVVILLAVVVVLIAQLQAQTCYPPNTSIWEDTWQSCQTSPNPNSVHGNSHWIQYDLGSIYQLYRTRFWNHNQVGQLNRGVKDIVIDYSLDGTNWTSLGTFQLPQAMGEAQYAGEIGPDFDGVDVRYVLITILSNWGHASCNGIAEVKFMLAPQILDQLDCDDVILNVNNNPILTDTYSAQTILNSTGTIDLNHNVTFTAGQCIELNPGFEIKQGSSLLAKIEACISQITP